MISKTYPLILITSIALVGCKTKSGGDNYVPKKKTALATAILPAGQELEYMPFKVGNQWTYTFETQIKQGNRIATVAPVEVTYKVVKVTPEPKGKYAILEIWTDDKQTDKQVWHIDNTGIYQVAIGKGLNKFSSPQPILKFPVKESMKFNWSGSGLSATGKQGKSNLASRVKGEEPIDAASGTFNAIAINTTGTITSSNFNGKTNIDTWIIPRVGLGRYRQELTGTSPDGKTQLAQILQLRLKSYSLKS